MVVVVVVVYKCCIYKIDTRLRLADCDLQQQQQTLTLNYSAVKWHSRSSAMSPFDRAHTTAYSTLIETMRLSCTVFEI